MVGIFVLPPSFVALEARLRGRPDADVPEDNLRRRLQAARGEIEACGKYDYVVVNDELDRCVDRLRCIVLSHRAQAGHMAQRAAEIAETFDALDHEH
jgi:guanylate kinase